MSDHKPKKTIGNKPPRAFGWMAEFSDENRLLEASRKVRDSGYTETDAFTPFPVHGIDEALGIKPTKLPFIVLCCGFTGLTLALLMQWWTNGVDYQYIISAKPMGITPASIPVAFEMTILFSAFSTFLGMLALNGLPRFSNPVFNNPRFDRATDDKFFLYVSSQDKYYNRDSVKDLLAGTGPDHLDEVIEDASPANIPRFIWLGALLVIMGGLIPGAIVLNLRASQSLNPRFHVFFDMDFQPSKKAQQTTTIFADGRTMRPQVPGTVARGQYDEQDAFYLGYDPTKLAIASQQGGVFVSAQDESAEAATDPAANGADSEQAPVATEPAMPWINEFPLEVNDDLMRIGQAKFNISCSACHGYTGEGNGLVNTRASAVSTTTWLPAANLHAPEIVDQPLGQIFKTISLGKGKMQGYASTLTPKERWAIVLYMKALQRSRDASIDDIPVDQRSQIEDLPSAMPAVEAKPEASATTPVETAPAATPAAPAAAPVAEPTTSEPAATTQPVAAESAKPAAEQKPAETENPAPTKAESE